MLLGKLLPDEALPLGVSLGLRLGESLPERAMALLSLLGLSLGLLLGKLLPDGELLGEASEKMVGAPVG